MNKIPRHILGTIILLILISVIFFVAKIFFRTKSNNHIYSGLISSFSSNIYSFDTCKFLMKYDSIKLYIVLSKDNKIEVAVASLIANETYIDSCSHSLIPPNKHTYQMQTSKISGNKLFIDFTPSLANIPICSLKLNGFIDKDKIFSTLSTQRNDSSDFNLRYSMNIGIQLDKVE